MVEKLAEIETRPWGDWSKGNPITVRQLARLLKPFKITPSKIRFGSTTLQGYLIEHFVDAFRRYLPIDPEHRNNPQETAENQPVRSGTRAADVPDEIVRKPTENMDCSGVPDEMPEKSGNTTYQVNEEDAEYDRLERLAIQTEDYFNIPDHLKRQPLAE